MSYSLIEDQKLLELNTKLDSIIQKLDEKQPPPSEWLTIEEVMKELHISKRCIFTYITQGKIGGSHLAGKRKLFFKREDVNKLISDNYFKAFYKKS